MLTCREIEKCIFYLHLFNMDISVAIAATYLKFQNIVSDILMEGTVSQIFYIGPSFYFMKCGNLVFKKYQKVSRFLS